MKSSLPQAVSSCMLAVLALLGTATFAAAQAQPDAGRPQPDCELSALDSPYIPVDSWVYPAMLRLYSLGFVDTVYLGMRPWTRASVSNMLDEAGARIEDADPGPATDEAESIYEAIDHEIHPEIEGPCGSFEGKSRIESVYTVARGISGTPLRDSYHLGQSVINDYGRPYDNGFSNDTGASGYLSAGRFLLYARGEFEHAPSGIGYSTGLADALFAIDYPGIGLTPSPQTTIPLGPLDSITRGRWLEAYVSGHFLNHEISFGKQDEWLGPGLGAGMAYSNNAENMYSFRINRVEPLHIPGLSYITGPFRYDFMVGALHGHNEIVNPNPGQANVYNSGNPWMHVEKISFRPTENLEFGFERSVIWGGEGHAPITLHTFLKSFFSFASPSSSVKKGRDDPGARFGAFDFSYRLPFLRKWLTVYSDSEVHDDVSPIDAPRRAAWRPGIYLSHFPGAPHLDLRVEAVSTDPPIANSNGGVFMYYESIVRQGYTNNGNLMGDWIGREGKGGQAWLTWHLSGNEWIQLNARNQKVAKDFVPGGTTLNDFGVQAVKRIGRDFEVNGRFNYQRWNAPIYPTGTPVYPSPDHTTTVTTIQLTWFPQRKVSF
ncbi:MAG TPA: capsule assembly Wzi family protein [Terracidiphilus sp.]|nr:capsule assembly Wzi family protein [Terracidiphilus sp.]